MGFALSLRSWNQSKPSVSWFSCSVVGLTIPNGKKSFGKTGASMRYMRALQRIGSDRERLSVDTGIVYPLSAFAYFKNSKPTC
jgi:hypothetical protein